ncbi:MAG TPA: CAP domain-containing protein, partial [Pyrinomonadaceae bacterium]|nr:CAP domain-containing protein [Pyrinomonadaceae bacterium]
KSLKLNTLETRASISKITARSIASTLLLLASLALCESALAQNLQPRPVARLISDPVADASYSRPRRVKLEENFPVTTEAAATNSLALDNANEVERRAFAQTNLARVENGLAPLVWDAELCRMARVHSEQMALLGYFSHETPEGLQLKERARASGIVHFRVIGENIAYNKGYDDPGGFAVERWMTSSGHRANILYGGFQAAAIGSYVSADGSTYLTQVFITR